MTNEPEIPWEAIADHLSGEGDAGQEQELVAWMAADSGNRALVEALRTAGARAVSPSLPPLDIAAEQQDLRQRIQNNTSSLQRRPGAPAVRRTASATRNWRFIRFGGVVAIAISVFAIVLGPFRTSRPVDAEYATRSGERSTLTLPGGSRVVLAPESRLRYRATSQGIQIALKGQAHFIVTPDARKTFVVTTGPVVTRVLGTVFEVQRYAEDTVTRVVVTAGRVASVAGDAEIVVTPGMQGVLRDSTAVVSPVPDPRTIGAWAGGRLVFKDSPVPEVLATVGRWSGYRFRLADSTLAKRYVTTVLPVDEPQRMMTLLKALLDVRMMVEDSVITLYPDSKGSMRKMPVSRNRETFVLSREMGQ